MTVFLPIGVNGTETSRVAQDSLLDAARFVALPMPGRGDARWEDYLSWLARFIEVAGVLLRRCGLKDPPGLHEEFPSPLPLEGNGLARLWRGSDESTILLVDERLCDAEEGFGPTITLVEVYASVMRGKLLRLSSSELAVWARRAYLDTNILDAEPVLLPPLPPGEKRKVQSLHATVQDVLTVRFMREIAPAPLTHAFLNGWSRQGERQIGEGMRRLLELGNIHQADRYKTAGKFPMALYKPGPCRDHDLDWLWRQPAGNPRWRCPQCECPALQVFIEVWTPKHGIIETTQSTYRRAELARGEPANSMQPAA